MTGQIKPRIFQVQEAFDLNGETKQPGEILALDDSTDANKLYESGHVAHWDEEVPKE